MVFGPPLLGDENLNLVPPRPDIVRDASDLWVYARREGSQETHQVHTLDTRCFKVHGEVLERVLLFDECLHVLVGALKVIEELLLLNREVRKLGALLETPDFSGGLLEARHCTVQALLDEIELTLGSLSDHIASEALQCRHRSVEDSRRQDRVGPPVAHVNDIRRFEGLRRQPPLDLTLYILGRMHHESEGAVLIGRGLRGQPEQTKVENRSNRAPGEFPPGGIQNPGLNALDIVYELQGAVRHGRIDPGIEKQLRAGQVGILREHPHSQIIDHPPGDLGRGQHLDL